MWRMWWERVTRHGCVRDQSLRTVELDLKVVVEVEVEVDQLKDKMR